MRLWKTIDLAGVKGGFVTLGDLDNDGRVDFLLSFVNEYSAHLRIMALDHDGRKLWDAGDQSIDKHSSSNPCRGICLAYDFDGDGETEVLVELWNEGKPQLALLEGRTGKIKLRRESPFDMSVRAPDARLLKPGIMQPSRSAPAASVARFAGRDASPSIIAKIDTSNTAPPYAVCLDPGLRLIWDLRPKITAIGHHMTVADINGDGRDEVIFGELGVDGEGTTIFNQDFGNHADMTEVFDSTDGRKRIVISVCNEGSVYCLRGNGELIWAKSKNVVTHGQAAWAGRFLPGLRDRQVIVLKSGHYGQFLTLDSESGAILAEFEHEEGITDESGNRKYPDMPTVFTWADLRSQSLWIPVDRRLVDGTGGTVADLGAADLEVTLRLDAGTTKQQLPVQAIAADLCGDGREEAVLYQPYQGAAIYLFTQADSDGREKRYVHQSGVYNRKSYF